MVTNDWSRALFWTPSSSPWNGFERLERMRRDAHALLAAHTGETQPPVRVHRGENALRIDVELPGRDPADIEVLVSERTLVVRGKAAPTETPAASGAARTNESLAAPVNESLAAPVAERREFSLPAFERSFQLPWNVDASGPRATFRHGVLAIELARAAEERPRRIEIQS